MTGIIFEDVHKSFGAVHVIKGVSLEIRSGEFMVFVGPSGCGKSTLLRLVSGLEDISGGTLRFGEEVVNALSPSERRIAMVFQSYALYPHLNVYDNMAFGLKIQGATKEELRERVMGAARMFQIEELLDRLPKQLSGGQRQRVAIGRAVVRDPRVFLFDEPLSNLDAALRVSMRLEIVKLHQDMHDVTMIYVTHDQVEAMTMADRICVLRDGIVEQVGTPTELYDRPNSLFVAGFIGSPQMNFLRGAFAEPFGAETLGVRSEHISLIPNADGEENGAAAVSPTWRGPVIHSEDLGSDTYIYVDVGAENPLTVRQEGHAMFAAGTVVSVRPDVDRIHLFGEDGRPRR